MEGFIWTGPMFTRALVESGSVICASAVAATKAMTTTPESVFSVSPKSSVRRPALRSLRFNQLTPHVKNRAVHLLNARDGRNGYDNTDIREAVDR